MGLGFVAYMFGLRHAFDADHIAAIGDTVRLLLQNGKWPLGTGFFFSLGHSTIVLALTGGIIFAAALVSRDLIAWQGIGTLVGMGVSGMFLCLVGILNLRILLEIVKIWRGAKMHRHSHAHVEDVLRRWGFLYRLLGNRIRRTIQHSRQMYPVGILFGLGFDTASEVGLLAMTAGASASHVPIGGVLCLPVLFAAGMTVMDTTDGILMTKAYEWAFVNPLRKLFYNLIITELSVSVALFIGIVELLQLSVRLLHLRGAFFDFVANLNFGSFGFMIVGFFLVTWIASVAVWKFGKLETHFAKDQAHGHAHEHEGGRIHSHKHCH